MTLDELFSSVKQEPASAPPSKSGMTLDELFSATAVTEPPATEAPAQSGKW